MGYLVINIIFVGRDAMEVAKEIVVTITDHSAMVGQEVRAV